MIESNVAVLFHLIVKCHELGLLVDRVAIEKRSDGEVTLLDIVRCSKRIDHHLEHSIRRIASKWSGGYGPLVTSYIKHYHSTTY